MHPSGWWRAGNESLGVDKPRPLGRVWQMLRAPKRNYDFLSLDQSDNSLSTSVP